MRWKLVLRRCALAVAVALSAGMLAAEARAVPFGPLVLVSPSTISSGMTTVQPIGAISLDVSSVPVTSPRVFSLTSVSVSALGLSFTLDPTLASPALGVVQPSGAFTIPTLFLRGDDGSGPFDLAVPNVTGLLYFDGADVVGIDSSFEFETELGERVTVDLYAVVPEPHTSLLIGFALAALAVRRPRKEIAR
jgi:hypothetical protein